MNKLRHAKPVKSFRPTAEVQKTIAATARKTRRNQTWVINQCILAGAPSLVGAEEAVPATTTP